MHRTDIERPFLAPTGFNTNLVQFLPCIMLLSVSCRSALLRERFPTCMDVHLKLFDLCTRKIIIYEDLIMGKGRRVDLMMT